MAKKSQENNDKRVLTSIHDAYTLCDTQGSSDSGVDVLMIKNFLIALAEVALAIAAREVNDR
ncbi:MAG: hypothetical protein PHY28_00180 [Dehalococcoidales bacterium]|nr:hypothetical protein [Dehalococcoidales bacterium]